MIVVNKFEILVEDSQYIEGMVNDFIKDKMIMYPPTVYVPTNSDGLQQVTVGIFYTENK